MAYKIMIMGASYGSLLASKLMFGGHSVHLICLPAEADLINAEGFRVRMPIRGRKEPVGIDPSSQNPFEPLGRSYKTTNIPIAIKMPGIINGNINATYTACIRRDFTTFIPYAASVPNIVATMVVRNAAHKEVAVASRHSRA